MSNLVLVINCGSSSIKFALFDMTEEQSLLSGLAERLNNEEAVLNIKHDGRKDLYVIGEPGHEPALRTLVTALEQRVDTRQIAAVGHRVVHGGEQFKTSALITDETLAAIKDCARLAPLHNPANALGIETARAIFPGLPQVAVFDTAFHQTMPKQAYLYPIPMRLYRDHGVRRYGFHGTSHAYVSAQAAERLGKNVEDSAWIVAHLGNGCSACAVKNGKSIDTSMGLTPLEGLVMGTRSGDVDPSLHSFLAEETGMSLAAITDMLNQESGLLGLSELSNDCRTLEEEAEAGHAQAELALEIFTYRLVKTIGAYATALGSLDGLVFTGGIGENSRRIRADVLRHLGILGFELDPALNQDNGDARGIITTAGSRRAAIVVPTNEELMIARDTLSLGGQT
jgi:acetate kinase